ncbi:M23 family metallopeptidase [Cohnella luojiensis]|uniref:M23 family metallopeptidase n=1 Tax=Cohnella luojiensis TaxID=652876 RepID=A0A4Y8LYR7_9BACL|nr:M23 family metallopeptidase [Cohnella luojiensis]TFE27264.1 M23 family metallopeptidase [Cohnella luojiensis]
MANRKRKPQWSLLLIRGADHRVKQFRVSGRTVVFLPVATALAVAGGFGALHLQSVNRIHELEARLASDSIQNSQDIAVKNGEIRSLEHELTLLSEQTNVIKSRMNELSELELKLRLFLGKQEDRLSGATVAAGTEDAEVFASGYFDSTESPVPDRLSMAAVESKIDDFTELSRMLDEMAISMAEGLRKAELKRAEIDAMPTEWPTVSRRLTSGFGYRRDPFTGKSTFHAGVDITGDSGDPIYAAGDGKVKEAGFNRTRGNYIIITHRDGLESWYMHLKVIGVKAEQNVDRGELIGEMGNSGRSTGPHLHFQVVVSETPVNPLPYLRHVKED